jgi:hypothetical protein
VNAALRVDAATECGGSPLPFDGEACFALSSA